MLITKKNTVSSFSVPIHIHETFGLLIFARINHAEALMLL